MKGRPKKRIISKHSKEMELFSIHSYETEKEFYNVRIIKSFAENFNLFASLKRAYGLEYYLESIVTATDILLEKKKKRMETIENVLIKKMIELSELNNLGYEDFREVIFVEIKDK